MMQADNDKSIKIRIFDGIKVVMELEAMLNETLRSNKANAITSLMLGSIIKKSQKNILRQVRDDIDKFISN